MKKRIIQFILLLIIIIVPIRINALSGSARCDAPGTVTVGQTFNVTISGSADMEVYWNGGLLNYSSSTIKINGSTGKYVTDSKSRSISKTFSFTALSVGSATVSQTITVNDADYNEVSFTSNTCNINVVAANSSNSQNNNSNNSGKKPTTNNNQKKDPNKSSNNNLGSLNIPDVELNPEFNKDTLEYNATVEGTTEKINIEGSAEDSKAYVEGLGEKDLVEGINEFYIYVTAENGDVKEYKIVINRKEKNPIEVTVNGKNYTVVKKETEIEIPEGFEKETITIDDEEVVAYSNEFISDVLVVLVDESGNYSLFGYNSKTNKFYEYIEYQSKNIRLMIIDSKEDIPFGYKKISFSIDGKKVNGFYYKKKDNFRLVYGINMANGDEGFYQYDMKQKTFQRFNNTQVKDYTKYIKYGVYGAGGVLLLIIILLISVISLSSKNRKLKKGNKELPKKEVIKEEPKKEVKPDTKKLSEKEMDEILNRTSTREGRRLQKEAEKKQKEEAKDFLK